MLRPAFAMFFSALALSAQVADHSATLGDLVRRDPGAALRQLSAETPDVFQGSLRSLVIDNPVTGRTETSMTLQSGNASYPVYAGTPLSVGCAASVTVRGFRVGDGILAASIENSGPLNLNICSTLGEQKTVVLLIETPSLRLTPTLITQDYVQKFMSTGPPPTVDGYFREASGGKTWITPTVMVPITMPEDQYGCADKRDPANGSPLTMLAAMAAADASVDFTQFNRIIMIARYPATGNCPTRVSSDFCDLLSTPGDGTVLSSWAYIAAELVDSPGAGVQLGSKALGAGLGMRYSYTRDYGTVPVGTPGALGTDLLKGDHSIMGAFRSYDGVYPLGHVSMPQKLVMGWIAKGPDYLEVTSTSTNTILPSASPSAGLKGLRIRRGTGYNEWFWIEYRKFLGNFDSTLLKYAPLLESGVLVHHDRPSDPVSVSFLLHFNPVSAPNDFRTAMLTPGTAWVDPSTNLSLQVTAVPTGMQVTATYGATGGCSYSVSQSTFTVGSAAGSGVINITTGPACQWAAGPPSSAFVSLRSPSAGTGNGSLTFDYTANGGAARSAAIAIESQTVTVNQGLGMQITGRLTVSGVALPGATITLSGAANQVATTNANGEYSLTGLTAGAYTLTPALAGYTFTPASVPVTLASTNQIADFTAIGAPITISLDRSKLNYAANATLSTPAQKVVLRFSRPGVANWTASSNQPWLQVSPASGTGPTRLTVSLGPGSLPASGVSNATVTISVPTATNPTLTIPVALTRLTTSTGPDGAFDTPVDGTTKIAGSIAVTGWALDDIYVSKVTLWRDPIGGEPVHSNGYVYIADAVFVAPSRPDIEGSRGTLPFQYRAGWGYLMLTTGVPNASGPKGNGTVKLWAIAQDIEGNTKNLGSKIITLDNANSKKPFGAIDTPNQGETISGNAFVNYGWALTPLPNIIGGGMPSQVLVSLNGPYVAAITYGQFRADIAGGFPGYRNTGSASTGGAGGYWILDTTQYPNGQHNIGWYVVDGANNDDGMGSRFFSIENGLTGGVVDLPPPAPKYELEATLERSVRARPKRGAVPQVLTAQELERLVLALPEGQWTGWHVVNGERRPLPPGSTLDTARGIFYWQLSPGILGPYELLFTSDDGAVHGITVTIEPKTYGSER